MGTPQEYSSIENRSRSTYRGTYSPYDNLLVINKHQSRPVLKIYFSEISLNKLFKDSVSFNKLIIADKKQRFWTPPRNVYHQNARAFVPYSVNVEPQHKTATYEKQY